MLLLLRLWPIVLCKEQQQQEGNVRTPPGSSGEEGKNPKSFAHYYLYIIECGFAFPSALHTPLRRCLLSFCRQELIVVHLLNRSRLRHPIPLSFTAIQCQYRLEFTWTLLCSE